jgi:hypothetical protein
MKSCLEEISSQMGTLLERDKGPMRLTQIEEALIVPTAPSRKPLLSCPPLLLPPPVQLKSPSSSSSASEALSFVQTIPATPPPCSQPAAQAAQPPASLTPISTPLKDSLPSPVSQRATGAPALATSHSPAKAVHSSKAPTSDSTHTYARVTCLAQNLSLTQDSSVTPHSLQPANPHSNSHPPTTREHMHSRPERIILRFTGGAIYRG